MCMFCMFGCGGHDAEYIPHIRLLFDKNYGILMHKKEY